ncbi:MAG: hypothetical protein FWC51_02185 [Proteobacteria bacterium]|nr:hypothetical protein [Pseudomonadota bacterium]
MENYFEILRQIATAGEKGLSASHALYRKLRTVYVTQIMRNEFLANHPYNTALCRKYR